MLNDLKYWVWLSSLPGIGSRRSYNLLQHFKSPKNIWNCSINDLRGLDFLSINNASKLLDSKYKDKVEIHLDNIVKNDIKIVTINDSYYPDYLKNIYDPPVVLYMKGTLQKNEKIVAVVGSRKATLYGLDIAEKISYELTKCGITVISGMARGVDSKAHRGALGAKGRTIAILGCGLDIVYPYENKSLRDEIVKNGAIISEYVPGIPPISRNFPARNRIISGMSLGVVVIEAGEKSGSLITANFALEQGREVFAVPGSVMSLNSKGTNKLIKDGAKIVTEIDDILEEIKIFKDVDLFNKKNEIVDMKNSKLKDLPREERIIAECLILKELHIDNLAAKTGLTIQEVNSLLIMMELDGIIEQMPGKIYKLK